MDGDPTFGVSQRQLPSNLQAEMALLGAIMANNRAFYTVSDFLEPKHFADEIHGLIYSVAGDRIAANRVADAITMGAELAMPLEPYGGRGYLAKLLASMITIKGAGEYGRAIRDAWVRRELINVGGELVNESFAATSSPEEMATEAFGRLTETVQNTGARKGFSLNEAMDAAIAAAEAAYQSGGVSGLSTGIKSLDRQLSGGLRPGNLIILGARPGMGKTGLAVQMAIRRAREAKRAIDLAKAAGVEPDPIASAGVMITSLEMSAEELGVRVLSEASGIPGSDIMQGKLEQKDFDRLIKARRELEGLPLTIEDAAGQDVAAIALKARMAKRRHGLSLVVVDHLQIVRTSDRDERSGNTVAVGKISGALKRLAKDMEIPVVLLAQLSRAVEGREDKRPQLSDLRYSGDIEADADVVLFIYRAEYYLGKGEPERRENESHDKWTDRIDAWHEAKRAMAGKAEIIASKVRGGATGMVPMIFHGPTTSFSEPEE